MSFMITRDNYEEFFLLYVDNELSAADRQIVERWVAENPDLKEEWEILLQCRIRPDNHLLFSGRESLLMQEGALAEDNYLEYFLSYVDGELDEVTRRSVDEFVRRHPSLRPELERLQQTVSVPDRAIVFENKEILYKKEKDRRIVLIPWRMVAAAVVVGVISLLIFNPLRKAPPVRSLGSTGNKTAPSKPGAPPAAKEQPNINGGTVRKDELADNGTSGTNDKQEGNGNLVVKKDSPAVTPGLATALHLSEAGYADRTAEVTKRRVPHNSHTDGKEREDDPGSRELAQTDPLINKRVVDQAPVRVITTSIKGPGKKMIVLTGLAVSGNPDAGSEENTSFATQALLNSSNDAPEDGFAMESSSPKKNKLRGLFRKVSRVLEKNASREEDDKHSVLIGGFQFALK